MAGLQGFQGRQAQRTGHMGVRIGCGSHPNDPELEQIAQQRLFFTTNDRGLNGTGGLAFLGRLFQTG
jgi:hypothetical protein